MKSLITFPTIETERLLLIEIQQEHLQDLFLLFGDDNVTQYYNIKTFQKPEDGQIYLDWFQSRYKERAGIRWGIQLKGEKHIAGTIGYNNFAENHRANLGYDLQSAYWNKGYMTEAGMAVTNTSWIITIEQTAWILMNCRKKGRKQSRLITFQKVN